ncbi:MAG TPA: leucine-rich repeat domain-containing protein [Bacteroidia bacterium]|jgi:Leucine-rich repeat (LRR) protein|nr:leucine-rich repeat domain-containing protein [Bacteroidia bacterium]
MKRALPVIFLLLFKLCNAQLLDSLSLDTMRGYTSLEDARANADKVVKLTLTKHKLTEFPAEIRKFKNLQYLDLSKNKIKDVPEWIGELTSLQKLVLSHNDIDTLPPQIGLLVNLKYFIMNRDPLNLLPNAIGGLTELRYLDMWGDNIGYFPSEISKLTKLKSFDLRDILISDDEQATLKGYLPHAVFFFSPSCSCKD